ncbi:MAG: class I SAM-dependent methyltransferase [Chitinophagaceae bacterium]|nr:class I SAM-dependent methyltransferase [Chitinophagaceae bacterium]MCW5904529.1 class I SAM-dependent methyltransferase [Chitinophagaceae bacterium]
MEVFDRKKHWENIYQTKQLNEVSWYQPKPQTSINIIEQFNLPKTANIIDIGGGDSFLIDYLLNNGYQNIAVLDIAETAIEKAKKRLGTKATKATWLVTDITDFKPTEKYDFWHDRAAFHFLTNETDIATYVQLVSENIQPNGIMTIATFSEKGPLKCSGIFIKQYSEETLTKTFEKDFDKIQCFTIDHQTPFNTTQNFLFGSFRKL